MYTGVVAVANVIEKCFFADEVIKTIRKLRFGIFLNHTIWP